MQLRTNCDEDFKGVADMKTRLMDGIEVQQGCGNVFDDLGDRDQERHAHPLGDSG